MDQLYRDIVLTSPDGIWVIDLDGRTVFANPQIARIHGMPESELADLTVFDTLDETGRAQFAEHVAEVRAGRVNEHAVEVQWVRRDGSTVWMLCSESTLVDDAGSTVLLHRYSDYDDRRAVVESLRRSEEALADQMRQDHLMQAVASAANGATSLLDVLLLARALVLVHDDWERARAFVPAPDDLDTGGGPGLVPLHADESEADADRDDPMSPLELTLAERCLESREPVWDERRLTIAFPVLLDDEVYAVVVITSAPPLWRFELIESMCARVAEQLARVAERERAQAQLAQARDAAMEASRQKSEFLATMSHEIRTPLHGVIGLNDLLLRSDLTPEQRRLATGVQGASRTLLGIINDVLDFSKIEAGHLELERIDFDVHTLLELVTTMLAETARAKDLELAVSVGPGVPPALSGDPTRLSQVVTNLVANAIKFTETGRVSVTADAEPVGDTGDTEGRVRLRVEVRDTGIGISAERRAHLFDPFTQADSSTTRVYGGSGLGLAISREIVEAMAGELEHADNTADGVGSVFTATVVLDQASGAGGVWSGRELPQPAAQEQGVVDGPTATVLVVEDNPVNQLVATGLLNALGYRSLTADDGPAAIELAPDPGVDAVLMDIQMPGMDGYEATRAIRAAEQEHPSGRRVPIIAMTASAVEGERERCLAAGMDDFLTKPVDPGRLASTLQQWLARAQETPTVLERLDLDRLDELLELDPRRTEAAYLYRAISSFLSSATDDLAQIHQAAAAGDGDELVSATHRVAGAALNVGAHTYGTAVREVENVAKAGDVSTAAASLAALEPLLADDVEALLAFVRHHFPATAA